MRRFLGFFFICFRRFIDKCIRCYYIRCFKRAGEGCYIGRNCVFTCDRISMGNKVYIGSGCVFQSAHGEIQIGNHVMFGPGVHIHGGNHIYNQIGVYMDEVTKEKGSDGTITIGNDVWVGSNAIILHGVCIGDGAIVGAGSIVTKNVEPYMIVAGNPAKPIKNRFVKEQLIDHLKKMQHRV